MCVYLMILTRDRVSPGRSSWRRGLGRRFVSPRSRHWLGFDPDSWWWRGTWSYPTILALLFALLQLRTDQRTNYINLLKTENRSKYKLHQSTPTENRSKYKLHQSTPTENRSKYKLYQSTPTENRSKYKLHQSTPTENRSKYKLYQSTPTENRSKYKLHQSTPTENRSKYKLHQSTQNWINSATQFKNAYLALLSRITVSIQKRNKI